MDGSAIEKLISDISKLPGLGRRSAQRIALYLLKNKNRYLLPLMQTLESSHKLITECDECGNVDMINPCNICSNKTETINQFVLLRMFQIYGLLREQASIEVCIMF